MTTAAPEACNPWTFARPVSDFESWLRQRQFFTWLSDHKVIVDALNSRVSYNDVWNFWDITIFPVDGQTVDELAIEFLALIYSKGLELEHGTCDETFRWMHGEATGNGVGYVQVFGLRAWIKPTEEV